MSTEARVAIETLFARYAKALDAGDLAACAALFAHATYRSDRSEVVLTGAEEVLAALEFSVRLHEGSPRTHHDITNLAVEVDGDTASATAYYSVLHAPPGSGPRVILTGRYLDTFERVESAWRWSDRFATFDLVGDLSTHLHLDRLGLELN